MARLTWSRPEDRKFETGLDRGVLYPLTGEAVSWNGLTGVDEAGGEGVSTYYMDGRPFLHFPTPREYSANLRAYTYPDRFAQILGFAEAADGLYLDSQQGESFNLSYRTLVGGALNPGKPDYKIHLIYNATVVPSEKSYGTIGEEINPIEFSWDIQAVPVAIPGYRATAHLIIDTRNVDRERLNIIESLLYGNETAEPQFPTPSALIDILSFTGAVTIVDNNDETWMVSGSAKNVRDNGDGTFVVRNVYKYDNGDGTYIVSTDPIAEPTARIMEYFTDRIDIPDPDPSLDVITASITESV